MASKIKVDQIQTGDGTGTIALQNQLSGMTSASMPTGSVVQTLQAVFTATYASASQSWVDTGISLSITPSSSSSKILITVQFTAGGGNNSNPSFRLSGGNSGVYIGDAAGNRNRVSVSLGNDFGGGTLGIQFGIPSSIVYLDSPATASAITYKLQARTDANGSWYINRDAEDPDTSGEGWRGASSITIQEIKG
jgi:hypothetical protein